MKSQQNTRVVYFRILAARALESSYLINQSTLFDK